MKSRQPSIRVTVVTLAVAFQASVQAQQDDGNNKILYPDESGLTYNYLDTVDVALTTDYESPYLYLYCWDASGNRQEIVFYSPSAVSGNSQVPVKLQSNTDYTGTTCWFNLLDAKSGSNTTSGATSPDFNYVKQEADQATFSLSSTASAATSTLSTQTTSTVSTTGISTPTTTSVLDAGSSGGGLSVGAQAGIGVGVGLVGLAILGVAIWLFVRKRRTQAGHFASKTEDSVPNLYATDGKSSPIEIASHDRYELSSHNPPSEMDPASHPLVLHELDTTTNRQ